MSWLADLIRALRYYLQIKAVTAQYDLQCRIEKDIETLEQERDALRKPGDAASQLRADVLQQRILRTQGIAVPNPEPAASPKAQGGSADSDH